MRPKWSSVATGSVVLALLSSGLFASLRAQSLGDLAKQEAERRKTVKEAAKVLTNKDVPQLPQAQQPAASAGAPDAAAADVAAPEKDGQSDKAGDAAKPGDVAKSGDTPKDEKYWSERNKGLQAQLARDQVYLEALQTRVNALTTDYVNRDDPAQRATIASDRQTALAEVTRLNAAIVADKKAITDFEDEARRAAVPPGWLR